MQMLDSIPGAIPGLIDGAVAALEVDRRTCRLYLLRAAAILKAGKVTPQVKEVSRERRISGGLAPWQVHRVVDFVEQHLAEKLACRQLADVVGISASHLSRSFKVSVGVTPSQYVAARRMELACSLIKTTNQSLAQIAFAAGLYDQSHFCRVFLRRFGMTPSAWRRTYGRSAIPVQRPPFAN